MGKKISGRDGVILGINSSEDMFEKLKYESIQLQKDWHPYDIFNFLVTAWHLFEDWPKSDNYKNLSKSKRQRNKLPKEMNFLLDIVRDIVNGSKHVKLKEKYALKRCVEEVHTGNEVGFYEFFFHEDLPGVTVNKTWYFSIRSLNNLVIRYYEWVFDDTIPVKQFPSDLTEAILYCNIAERKQGSSPELWLKNIESAYKNRNKIKKKNA